MLSFSCLSKTKKTPLITLFLISPLLISPPFLPVCFKLQQLCLPCSHLVFEDAALDLHAFQQPPQLLHLLIPLLRQLLCLLQPLRLLSQMNAVLI